MSDKPKVRKHLNQVTDKIEETVLDKVQLAKEAIHRALDVQMMKLGPAQRDQLIDEVFDLLLGMKRNTY